MGLLTELTKFKLKAYFGSVRASRTNLVMMIVYYGGIALSLIPLAAGLSVVGGSINFMLFLDSTSTFLVIPLALALIYALWGRVPVSPFEYDFVLTTPIKSWQYLTAGLLTNLIIANILILSLAFIFLSIMLIPRIPLFTFILMLAFIEVYAVFILALASGLSVFVALSENKLLKILISALVIILLIPGLSYIGYFPVRYSQMLYPSTLTAQVLFSLLAGEFNVNSIVFFMVYSAAVFLIFWQASMQNFVYKSMPILRASPFDLGMGAQRLKAQSQLKTFGRLSGLLSLNFETPSLHRFLTRKEIVRMVRDGSLISSLIIFAIYGMTIIGTLQFTRTPEGMQGFYTVGLPTLVFYASILPFIFITNWRAIEAESLWIAVTSGVSLKDYFRALILSILLVTLPILIVMILALSLYTKSLLLWPLIGSIIMVAIAASTALYLQVRYLKAGAEYFPTMVVGLLTMILVNILASPIYIAIIFASTLTLIPQVLILGALAFYSATIVHIFSNRIEKAALKLEL